MKDQKKVEPTIEKVVNSKTKKNLENEVEETLVKPENQKPAKKKVSTTASVENEEKNETKQTQKKQILNDLGEKYGTDKSNLLHGYLNVYESLFKKPDEVKKVVELGLQRKGGEWANSELPSVKMWLDFFPNAHVFGFDAQDLKIDHDRVTIHKGQQGRIKHHIEFSQQIGWDIDFVIDDCSHRPTDSLLSLLFFWPRLKKGGIYIVEDVQAVIQDEYPEWMRTENYLPQYIDHLNAQVKWVDSKSSGKNSSLVLIKK